MFLAGSGLQVPNTLLGGSAKFDVSIDIDSLKLDGDFSIQLKLDWIKDVQTLATDTLTFSSKEDGQPPYNVNMKKEGVQAESFRIWATVFDGKDRYSKKYSLAVFNLNLLLLTKDDSGNSGKQSSTAGPRQTTSTAVSTNSSSNRPSPTTTSTRTFNADDSTTTSSATVPAATTSRNVGMREVPSLGLLVVLLVVSIFP